MINTATTKLVFLIDNSASMARASREGISVLDCAKSAVERFVLIRSKLQLHDQYILACTSPVHVASPLPCVLFHPFSKKKSRKTLTQSLKLLQTNHVSFYAHALQSVLSLINRQRLKTDIDNIARGRIPWNTESAVIFILTDDSNQPDVQQLLPLMFASDSDGNILQHPQDYHSHLVRWDQRIFVLSINNKQNDRKQSTSDHLQAQLVKLAQLTSGETHSFNSLKSLNTWMEAFSNKLMQCGRGFVCQIANVSKFNPIDSVLPRVFIKTPAEVQSKTWPLPEDIIQETELNYIPQRLSHPILLLNDDISSEEELLLEKFQNNKIAVPFDRYELDCSGKRSENLFREIKETKKKARSSNRIFVLVSMYLKNQSTISKPIGLLHLTGNTAEFLVMPYNFLELFQLIDLLNDQRKTPLNIRSQISRYIMSVPVYYFPNLASAVFSRYPVFHQVHQDLCFSKGVLRTGSLSQEPMMHLYQLREQSLADVDTWNEVGITGEEMDYQVSLRCIASAQGSSELFEAISGRIWKVASGISDSLIEIDDESKRFQVPISEMGDFQRAMHAREVLRDPMSEDENSERRVNFGSRYRRSKSKTSLVSVDETDEGVGIEDVKRVCLRDVWEVDEMKELRKLWRLLCRGVQRLSEKSVLLSKVDECIVSLTRVCDRDSMSSMLSLLREEASLYRNAVLESWLADRTHKL